jgi:hypothetical protein
LSVDSPILDSSEFSDNELVDDEDQIEVGSQSTSLLTKRRHSSSRGSISESISASSDPNRFKRKRSRISSGTDFALAIDKLTAHLDGVKSALNKKDWVQEAVDVLFSSEIAESLTDEEVSLGTTLLADESKAKMFCLIPRKNMKIAFLQREVKRVEGSNV